MSQPQHTYTLRQEVGFGIELALSQLGEPHQIQIENFKGNVFAVRITDDPLASLRAESLWTTFNVTAGILTTVPAGTRKLAVENVQVGSGPTTVFHLPGFFRGAENARYYGVDQLTLPPPPVPPATTATLQHFFDLSDEAGVFSDEAGTIPSGAGGDVRHIVNTGADGTPMTAVDVDATIPQYLHGVLNGKNVLSNVAGVSSGDISGSIAAAGGVAGAALVIVARSRDAANLVDDMFRWFSIPGSVALFADKPSGRWEPTITDDANPATGKPVVLDEWIWAYVTADNATGDFRIRVSGASELQLNTTYTAVPGGATMRLLGDIGELAMAAVYDGPLSVAETDAWINDFIVPKWGALPA